MGRKKKRKPLFVRRCRRCERLYRTEGKFSKICPKCSKNKFGWHKAKIKILKEVE